MNRLKSKEAEVKYSGVGNAAVLAKTGNNWHGWFKLLDKAKAYQLTHAQIAEMLHGQHGLNGWWSQMVTVGYEQYKGLRVKNQNSDGGFRVDVSKTIATDVKHLYSLVENEALRKAWLKGKVEIRGLTPNKTIRANYAGKTANLVVMLYHKGPGKAQVVIAEGKLEGEQQVEERRLYWKKALEKLAQLCTASPVPAAKRAAKKA